MEIVIDTVQFPLRALRSTINHEIRKQTSENRTYRRRVEEIHLFSMNRKSYGFIEEGASCDAKVSLKENWVQT